MKKINFCSTIVANFFNNISGSESEIDILVSEVINSTSFDYLDQHGNTHTTTAHEILLELDRKDLWRMAFEKIKSIGCTSQVLSKIIEISMCFNDGDTLKDLVNINIGGVDSKKRIIQSMNYWRRNRSENTFNALTKVFDAYIKYNPNDSELINNALIAMYKYFGEDDRVVKWIAENKKAILSAFEWGKYINDSISYVFSSPNIVKELKDVEGFVSHTNELSLNTFWAMVSEGYASSEVVLLIEAEKCIEDEKNNKLMLNFIDLPNQFKEMHPQDFNIHINEEQWSRHLQSVVYHMAQLGSPEDSVQKVATLFHYFSKRLNKRSLNEIVNKDLDIRRNQEKSLLTIPGCALTEKLLLNIASMDACAPSVSSVKRASAL